MIKLKMNLLILCTLCFVSAVFAGGHKAQRFLFIGSDSPKTIEARLNNDVDGVQIVYDWKSLEAQKDLYTFEQIERDLQFLNSKGKKLWVQLQDRFFRAQDQLVPRYLLEETIYGGALASQKDNPGEGQTEGRGWVTKQWNPHVRARYQKLLRELARQFDGRIYGINLPETAADIDLKAESRSGFSCDNYFQGTTENINSARAAFSKSHVVQYVNFWPCEWDNDHNYMGRFFQNALEKKIGLGGPDIVPHRKAQMKNAYPFFHMFKGRISTVAFAVQEPTRTYINPKTGRKFNDQEFLDFGQDYLGANIIFWSAESK